LPPKDDFCTFTFRKFQTVSEKTVSENLNWFQKVLDSFRKIVSEKIVSEKIQKHVVKVYNDPEMTR
jgi:hypothetical protein